jgi:hypothetical protein
MIGLDPLWWTVSNLSFHPLIFIQRIPQRSLPPQAAEVQWLTFFFLLAWWRPECKAPGATISIDPWGLYPRIFHD